MDNSYDPHADPAHLLPREVFQEIMLILRGALPPPHADGPEDWARRDRAAMAAVASLRPETAAEGRLAAQFVAADAWAMDCLLLAGERRLEVEVARKCRAQAMSMLREGKSSLRALQRLQAERRKIEGDEGQAEQAAWAEHAALRMMAEALGGAGADVGRECPARSAAPQARTAEVVDGRHKAGHDDEGTAGHDDEGTAGHDGEGLDGAGPDRLGPGTGDVRAVSRHAINLCDIGRETVPRPWAETLGGGSELVIRGKAPTRPMPPLPRSPRWP